MQENQVKGDLPDFKGSISVAAWKNIDKNGNAYLSIILGNRAALFPVDKVLGGEEVEEKEVVDIFE